jgi:hypothetical protein
MLKTNSTLVTKNQLLDYVSKRDFNDFVAEMRDFRDITETRFDAIDKRFNAVDARLDSIDQRFGSMDKRFISIDRKLDKLGDDFRIQVGAVLDQFKEQMQINREHMQGVEARLRKEIHEKNN